MFALSRSASLAGTSFAGARHATKSSTVPRTPVKSNNYSLFATKRQSNRQNDRSSRYSTAFGNTKTSVEAELSGLAAFAGLFALWQLSTDNESEAEAKKKTQIQKKEEDGPQDENPLSDLAASYKQKLQGNYENRIRDFSTPEKIFIYFASVRRDGQLYMTPWDFLRAITPYNYRKETQVGAGNILNGPGPLVHQENLNLPESFRLPDDEGDGLISFGEFLMFSTLLAIPEQHFDIAFKVFDQNGDGTVDVVEFKHFMHALRQATPLGQAQRRYGKQVENAGVSHFFGKDPTRKLTYREFKGFLMTLHEDVLRLEYAQLDNERKGYITPAEFAMSVASYANVMHEADYQKKVAELEKKKDVKISFEQFSNFNRVLRNADDIQVAIDLYHKSKPFTKADLKRATKAVTEVELDDAVLDTVFFLFDKNNDNELDYKEFHKILKRRAQRGLNTKRDLGVSSFVNCCKECFVSNIQRN